MLTHKFLYLSLSALSVLTAAAQTGITTTVWNNDFLSALPPSGVSTILAGTGASITGANDDLVLNSGSVNAGRAFWYVSGTNNGYATTSGGKSIYDFTAHNVTATFSIASLSNYRTDHDNFVFAIGSVLPAGGYISGAQIGNGVRYELDWNGTHYRIQRMVVSNGTAGSIASMGNLAGVPTSIAFRVGATSTAITVTGTTWLSAQSGVGALSNSSLTNTTSYTTPSGSFATSHLLFGAHSVADSSGFTGAVTSLDTYTVSVDAQIGDFTYALTSAGAVITGYTGVGGAVSIPSFVGDNVTVKRIEERAFAGNSTITSISVPAGVSSIGFGAFAGSTNLTSINVNAGNADFITYDGCLYFMPLSGDGLSRRGAQLLKVPEGKTGGHAAQGNGDVYDGALKNSKLTSFTMRVWAQAFGREAFANMTGLTSLTFPENTRYLAEDALNGCTNLATITTHEKSLYFTAVNNSLFYRSKHGESTRRIPSNSGIGRDRQTYFLNGAALMKVPSGTTGSYVVPSQVSFVTDKTTTPVTTSLYNVNEITSHAFNLCTGITSLSIPATVEAIGLDAFSSLSSLTTLNVAANNPAYTVVNNVLYNKSMSVLLWAPKNLTGTFSVPHTVKEIKLNAFAGSATLSAVLLPEGLRILGHQAFANCPQLTSVKFTGNAPYLVAPTAFRNSGSNLAVTYPPGAQGYNTISWVGFTPSAASGIAQTIDFQPPATLPISGGTLSLVATSSSGLPVTFTLESGPATLSGGVLTPTAAGDLWVSADQSGNGVSAPAPRITKKITVLPASLATLVSAIDLSNADLRSATNPWVLDGTTSAQGSTSVKSGVIGDNQSSSMELTVNDVAEVSFKWKVSSQTSDVLTFHVDSSLRAQISGTVDWQTVSFTLPPGRHLLSWIYTKNGSLSAGSDAGWVDHVVLQSATPFKNWIYASRIANGLNGSAQDADGDGIPNLMEFAMGTLATRANNPARTETSKQMVSGTPHFKFKHTRNKAAAGNIIYQQSETLGSGASWSRIWTNPIQTAGSVAGDADLEEVEIYVPMSSSPTWFMRMQVNE